MISKRFKNDDGAIETTLMGLIFSLTFSSMVIAFLLVQAYGYDVTGDESSINIPTSGIVDGMQDFKTNDITDNVNYADSNSRYTFMPNVGRVLTASPPSLWDGLYLAHVSDIDGVYTISYNINNSVKQDYAVFVRMNTVLLPYNIRVDVTNTGFRIPNGIIDTITDNYYPYSTSPNQIENVKIKTVYDKKSGTLKFYFNDKLAFTKTGISDVPSFLDNGATFYAGVASKTLGFTVESIDAGSFNFDSTDIISQIAGFFDVLFRIIVWNVNPQFLPNELNIIFIKTQLFGIIICIVMILRGN